jgi:hypothetical protein
MPLEITVALIADAHDPLHQMIPEEEFARPYAERQKICLPVDETETLAAILQRAAIGLGVSRPQELGGPESVAYGRIAFYKPSDEESFAPRAMPRLHWAQLVLVDDRGRAVFGVRDQRAVTCADLLRAAEVGVLDGDPLRPYLFVEPGWGDAPPPDWPTVLTGLEIARQMLEGIATAGGAWAFADAIVRRVRERVGVGKKTAQGHREWAQRGTRPYQFVALILTRDWTSDELGSLLGCTNAEAEAVLWMLGFSFDNKDEIWRFAGDAEAEIIRAIHDQIAIAAHRGGSEWQAELRRRVSMLLETGESPPVDLDLPSGDGKSDYAWRPTAGERLGGFVDDALDRIRRHR